MDKKYSLNDVDNFILKHKNKKNPQLIVNTHKNDIENKLSIIKNKEENKYIYTINNNNKNNIVKKPFCNDIKNRESKNNYNNIISKNNNKPEIISIFINIYSSFSNNLNIINKENVFASNILDNYLNELDLNYEDYKERHDKIIAKKGAKEKKIINNDNSKNISSYIKREPIIKNYYNFNQNYIIKNLQKENKIILKDCFSFLFKDVDYFLYNNYYPVSYENNDINLKKYQDLLSELINKNYIKDSMGKITIIIIQYILSNNIDFDKINIFNNSDVKNKILNILSNLSKNKTNSKSNFSSFINTKKVFNLLNNPNDNFPEYNIASTQDNNPLYFVIQLFTNKILDKSKNIAYFYILLLYVNEKNISEYSKEIFQNFEICLFIIFTYFSKSEKDIKNICKILLNNSCQNMNLCQYIILKIILANYEVKNEKFYSKIFTSFLNLPSMEKLLIADCYNLILYTINSTVKNIFAKSSILIKYKYSILKQKYKQDENDLILKGKIYDNIEQFGTFHKNNFFRDYIKNEFCCKDNIDFIKNNQDNNNNTNYGIIEEEKNKNNKEKKENNVNNSGLFSSIKFVFGFGDDNAKNKKFEQ